MLTLFEFIRKVAAGKYVTPAPALVNGQEHELLLASDASLVTSASASSVTKVEGAEAHDAPATKNPVRTGLRAYAEGAFPAAVSLAGDVVDAIGDMYGRVHTNLSAIAGTSVLSGGVNGSLGVGGLAAQGSVMSGSPVPAAGQYRSDPTALALDNTDVAAPGLDKQGHLVPRSDWQPIDGGGQRVNIGVAAYSTALTVGAEYLITAKVDCWIAAVANNATPAVLGSDFFLPAYTPFQHVCREGLTYIAVITDSATMANGLMICRVR